MNPRDDSCAPAPAITLLIADVDGTLVTPEKVLTADTADAVRRLSKAAVSFTLVSSRPPRGMGLLISTLGVKLPFAAFNGGALVGPDMKVIKAHHLSQHVARATLELLARREIAVWVYADGDWRLRDPAGPFVSAHQNTVGFAPKAVKGFEDVIDRIDKIVGVCDQPARLAEAEVEARDVLAGRATISLSQAYYLDITHRDANKGQAVLAICEILGIDPLHTAVIGDMMNDVSMFQVAGFALAMGQAPDAVKARADAVTASNAAEGFSRAVDRFILPRARPAAMGKN